MFTFKAGSTSKSVYAKLVDSSSFLAKTGLVYTDLTIYYTLPGAAAVAITLATLTSPSAAWSSGGFKEVDATNAPGLYRLDVPNAVLAAGPFAILTLKASLVKDEALLLFLPAYDPYDSAALGLGSVTAIKAKTDNLPPDPADASDIAASFSSVNGTLATIAGYVDTEVGAIKSKTDQLTFTKSNELDVNLKSIHSVTINGDGATTPFGP